MPSFLPHHFRSGLIIIALRPRKRRIDRRTDSKRHPDQQEAEDIRADLVRESNTIPAHAIAGGKSTDRLNIGMRMQLQYANLDTDIKGAAVQPSVVNHAALRRMYLTFKAGVGGNWGATLTYDFAGGGYDDAIVEWKPTNDLAFNFGLRKVNVAYEERASSGHIRAIERSASRATSSNPTTAVGSAPRVIASARFSTARKELTERHALRLQRRRHDAGAQRDVHRVLRFRRWHATTRRHSGATSASPARFGERGHMDRRRRHGIPPGPRWLRHHELRPRFRSQALLGLLRHQCAELGPHGGVSHGRHRARRLRDARCASPQGSIIQPSLMLTDSIEAVVRYAWLNTDGRGVHARPTSSALRQAAAR